MKTLIVIDMQNDFIDGALGTPEAQAIVPNVKKKIEEYDAREDAIIFTRDTHFDSYLSTNEGKNLPVKHCIVDTHGWKIADGLEVPCARYIDKPTFGWTGWGRLEFEDGDEIEIVGLVADICVISNALILKALFPECKIIVDSKCTAGTTNENYQSALNIMRSCQIEVI